MGFAVFLGLLVVLVGVGIILEAIFHIHVPLARTAFGLLLVYLGVRVVAGAWSPVHHGGGRSAVFGERSFPPPEPARERTKYDVVFGRGTIDLTGMTQGERDVQIDTVFGTAIVRIDPAVPLEIQATTAFGQVEMPDRNSVAFGTLRYRPRGQQEPPRLRVKLNVVFGSCHVQELAAAAPGSPPPNAPAW